MNPLGFFDNNYGICYVLALASICSAFYYHLNKDDDDL